MKSSTPVLLCSVTGYDASGRVDDMAAQQGKQCTSIAIGKEGGREGGREGRICQGPYYRNDCTEYTKLITVPSQVLLRASALQRRPSPLPPRQVAGYC